MAKNLHSLKEKEVEGMEKKKPEPQSLQMYIAVLSDWA